MKTTHIYIYTLALIYSLSGFAQTPEQAKEMFKKGEYIQAKSVFARQIKSRPNDANLNQWYGVCLYETGEKAAAEKHLLIASQKAIPEASRYLGEWYYTNYRFEEAVEQWSKYIAYPNLPAENISAYTTKLKYAESALRLIRGVVKVEFIDSLVVNKEEFLKHYRLSPESGALKSYDTHFSEQTRKFASVYENERKDRVYFATQSENKDFDICSSDKLIDTWSEKKRLESPVNSPANENFPFLMPDGTTLYFASDREGSMGGYDLFVTRLNLADNSFLTPENMGMPFNSTANDYMLAIDEHLRIGWFATDRNQPAGKVAIYTFVPREEKVVYENLSPTQQISMAKLNSIKDSRSPESGKYKTLLNSLSKPEPTTTDSVAVKSNFVFIVNDKRILKNISDCKNANSIKLINNWLSAKALLETQSALLDKARKRYRSANSAEKKELESSILTNEKRVEELTIRLSDLEKNIREIESKTANP